MEVPRGMEPTGTNGRTRHTLSDPPSWLGGWVSSCGGFLVGWQGTLFLVVTTMMIGKAFCLRPLSGSRTATTGIGRVAGFGFAGRRFSGWPYRIGFAVVMAQVRRPVPFRTRKLRPGTAMVLHSRGCGRVARRRIQLSGPSGRVPLGDSRKVLFFYSHGTFSSGRWGIIDVGNPVRGRIPPVGGRNGTPGDRSAGAFLQWMEVFGLWKACGRTGYSSEWMIWDAEICVGR